MADSLTWLLTRLVQWVYIGLAINENKKLAGGGGCPSEVDGMRGKHGDVDGAKGHSHQDTVSMTKLVGATLSLRGGTIRKDVTGIVNLASGKHANALPESQTETQIDNGIFGGEQKAKQG